MAEVKDLVVQEPLDVAKIFTPEGMSGLLQDIETQVKAHVPVIDTDEGRKNIISLAYKVSQSKSLIVKTGEREVETAKKKVKAMGVLLKTAKDFLDDLRDETRKPVTDWENEQKRIADEEARKEAEKIDKRVADLLAVEVTMPRIDVATMTDEEFDTLIFDKTEEWRFEQDTIAEKLAAENKRLEEEAAARRAEKERLDKIAEQQKIQAEALEKQQAELIAKERAFQEERDRVRREEQVKIDAENARIKAEAEAKAKAEREVKEAEERKIATENEAKRQEALRPDKEKLNRWLSDLQKSFYNNAPELSTEESESIFNDIVYIFNQFITSAFDRVK